MAAAGLGQKERERRAKNQPLNFLPKYLGRCGCVLTAQAGEASHVIRSYATLDAARIWFSSVGLQTRTRFSRPGTKDDNFSSPSLLLLHWCQTMLGWIRELFLRASSSSSSEGGGKLDNQLVTSLSSSCHDKTALHRCCMKTPSLEGAKPISFIHTQKPRGLIIYQRCSPVVRMYVASPLRYDKGAIAR